jgi:hypothetical protein
VAHQLHDLKGVIVWLQIRQQVTDIEMVPFVTALRSITHWLTVGQNEAQTENSWIKKKMERLSKVFEERNNKSRLPIWIWETAFTFLVP